MKELELPVDLVFSEILPRLPAKSLLRFKYVSKVWLSYIKSTKFAQIHLRKNAETQNQKLLVNIETYNGYGGLKGKLYTTDFTAKNHDGNCFEFPLETHKPRFILGSCNGLVCIGIGPLGSEVSKKSIDLVIWKPLTGEYKKLRPSSSLSIACHGDLCGLGHDPSTNDYKVLHVTKDQGVYIYSLRSQSKRYIASYDGKFSDYSFNYKTRKGFCVQGILYWKVVKNVSGNHESLKILGFDLGSETFTELPFPVVVEDDGFHQNLSIHCGCLHVFSTNPSRKIIDVWRMDEKKTREWVKVMSVSLVYDADYFLFRPVCFMSSKQILLVFSGKNGIQLVTYDIDNHTSESCLPIDYGTAIFPTYVETLISPNL